MLGNPSLVCFFKVISQYSHTENHKTSEAYNANRTLYKYEVFFWGGGFRLKFVGTLYVYFSISIYNRSLLAIFCFIEGRNTTSIWSLSWACVIYRRSEIQCTLQSETKGILFSLRLFLWPVLLTAVGSFKNPMDFSKLSPRNSFCTPSKKQSRGQNVIPKSCQAQHSPSLLTNYTQAQMHVTLHRYSSNTKCRTLQGSTRRNFPYENLPPLDVNNKAGNSNS